ncbi:VOC family protein [Streptomyces sp. NRRL S-31]|uniref:VOC family protein n=1 Tax=Streptomyces sp. NRRL S-31 TaxID=1463898 RepID=UPI0004CAC188|nr:VOC family protein [Streptomyces sp. NRRL S-31]
MLTTRFVDGAPNWIDVGSPDLDGAAAFYGALFGWRFRSAGPDADGYGFFRLDGKTVAGGMPTGPGQGPPAWTVYFRSQDARATAEAAEQAHGRVLSQPLDVRGEGHMAILADQAGVPFGIWQPGRTTGVEAAGEPGALCWVELYTPDIAAAAAFYHKVLGLETSAVPFPAGTYTGVNPAGAGDDALFGGMVPLADAPAEAEAGPYWLPYFEVRDTDAVVERAERLGATVRMPATTVEGVGRTARLADPYGARFAVITSEPPQD